MSDQSADLTWRDNHVPVSERFDDPYFSLENGVAETRHVFLSGNGLPERFAPGFQIAELGFGTGLNLFVALQAWRIAGMSGPLYFTSFEAFPLSASDMAQALGAFPELGALAEPFLKEWDKGHTRIELEDLIVEVIIGDARKTLPAWTGRADAWFLDGFSPAKNPELWGADLLATVADHTALQGTAATYTAAGHVRRALEAAGFEVARQTGYGRKRHMTVARKGV